MSFKKLQKKQQGGKMLFPPIYQRPVSDNTIISTPQQTLQQDKVNQQAAFNQLQANKKYIGKPTGKLSLEQRDAKTKQLAEEQGLRFNPITGRTDTQFVPFSKTENTVLKAGDLTGDLIEGAAILDGIGELGNLTKGAIKTSMENGTLSNTYKINPLAKGNRFNKFNPDSFYRQVDEDTFKEGLESGLIKGKQNIPQGEGINLNRSFGDDAYYNKGTTYFKDNTNPYLFEVNKGEDAFIPKVNGRTKKYTVDNTTVRVSKQPIPLEDATIYKKDWLKGYKPIKQQGGFSTEGYKSNSKDRFNSYNIIPSPSITMKGVNHKILGISDTGEQRLMLPDEEHYFEGANTVTEFPIKEFKSGGSLHKGEAKAILNDGHVYGHALSKKQISFFKQLAKKESKGLSKKQEGGLWNTNKKAFVDSTLNANKKLDFVQRLYGQNNPSIQVKGEPERSTHLMAYDPKSRRVFPEVVRQNGKLSFLNGDNAYDYADKTGEFIQFKTPQQADWFSSNGYKIGTNVNNSINPQGIPYNNPNYVIPKHQQGGFNQLQPNINNWQTDENYQHPLNYNQQAPLYKIPEENRLQNPVQITPTGKTPEPFITNKSQTDLSFAPLMVNSIASAIATRVNNNRDNNYQQTNLSNPFNTIPIGNNTNSYQQYGQQQYQMGGEVSQDDSDFEDMADEDFLFGADENIQQPIVQKQEIPEEVQQPVQEEEQNIIQPDMSIWDDTNDEGMSNITSTVGLSISNNIRPSGNLDNDIAAIESGGDYKADNPNSSAVGKYQFIWGNKPGVGWGNDIKRVTGVSSPEEFKNNPKAQEEFYSYYKYNHMIPAIQRLRRYNTQGLSDDALGKLFHFKGEAGAKKYLTEGIDDTHANNISIPKYIGK